MADDKVNQPDKTGEGQQTPGTAVAPTPAPQTPPANPPKGDSGTPGAIEVDPLAKGRKFKKVGDFVVDASFDPTLTPEYRNLRDKQIRESEEAKTKLESMEAKVTELTTALSEKKDLAEDVRAHLEGTLDSLKSEVDVAKKDAKAARVELLRVQIAQVKGLPYNYVKYVVGDTAETVEASVKKVLEDFNLQKGKVSPEELEAAKTAAAEQARRETEEALKNRGTSTENGEGTDHIFTRTEIGAMSVDEYKANREKISEQVAKGLLK